MAESLSTEEEAWCNARATEVVDCVKRLELPSGRIGEWPAWHVMPYASIWAVESQHRPEWIGWWVIVGDLPSDAISAQGVDTPRAALRAFGKRWLDHGASLDGGSVPQAWAHLPDGELPKLTALLKRRGAALKAWAEDDSAWPADDTENETAPDA